MQDLKVQKDLPFCVGQCLRPTSGEVTSKELKIHVLIQENMNTILLFKTKKHLLFSWHLDQVQLYEIL